MMAQCRDVKTIPSCHIQQELAFFAGAFFSVNGNLYHASCPPSHCFYRVKPAGLSAAFRRKYILRDRSCAASSFPPLMAPAGHPFAHISQPMHFASSISNRVRFLQTPAGHLFSRIWASYSSRKYLIVVRIGLGALLPRLHNDASAQRGRFRSSSFNVSFSSSALADIRQDLQQSAAGPPCRAYTCRSSPHRGSLYNTWPLPPYSSCHP